MPSRTLHLIVAVITLAMGCLWVGMDALLLPRLSDSATQHASSDYLLRLLFALPLAALLYGVTYHSHCRLCPTIGSHSHRKLALLTASAFWVALQISGAFFHVEHQQEVNFKRSQTLATAALYGDTLSHLISQSIAATKALELLLIADKGQIENFDHVAEAILRTAPAITNLQLAPQGIVRTIVPLAGNEAAIGHDLLKDPKRSAEALAAIETGKLTLAGPFQLKQGGVAVIARQPVFVSGETGERTFWGFANALQRLQPLLEMAQISRLSDNHYAWSLHRIHPDTQAQDYFAGAQFDPQLDPITYPIKVPNGQWFLSIAPQQGWAESSHTLHDYLYMLGTLLVVTVLIYNGLRYPQRLAHDLDHRTRELSAERQLLQQAQAISKSGSWNYDLRTNSRQCSTEGYNILGLESGTALQPRRLIAHIHPDDRANVHQAWAASLHGHSYEILYRYRVGAGYKWIKENAIPFFGPDQSVHSIVGVFQDITQLHEAQTQLQESEQRLQLAVEGTDLGLWDANLITGQITFNDRWATMLGYQPDELEPTMAQWQRLVHPDDLPKALLSLTQHLNGMHDVYQADVRMRTKSGRWRWVQTKGKLFERTSNGAPLRALGTHLDIDERKKLEQKLKTLSLAIEHSPVATLVTSPEPKIIYVNPSFTQATGYTLAEVQGKNPKLLQSGLTDLETYRNLWQTLSSKEVWHNELWNRKKDGTLALEKISISPVLDEQGEITNYVAVKQDITLQRQMEETIWQQANFDLLTGLANRAHFTERCQQALKRAERNRAQVMILFIDLDKFKPINDQHGHDAGDLVLTEFARRLAGAIRGSDTAARMGGDEFTVVMEDLSKDLAVEGIIHNLHQALVERDYALPATEGRATPLQVSLGASIGYALYPSDGLSVEELLVHADHSMYRAKQADNLDRTSSLN